MSKEARLIAAVVAVVVVIIGALVIFGGDDDTEVKASDTSAATGSDEAPSSTTAEASTTPEASTTVAPDLGTEAPADPSAPPSSKAGTPTVTVAPGSVSINQAASWQGGLQADTVRSRFDAADASDDLCTRLVALTSLPDINSLPQYSKDDLAEYFARWQALADRTAPQTEGTMTDRLQAARAALLTVEQAVNESGGTFNEAAVDQILGADGSELTQLLALFVLVADECPAPPAG